MTPAESESILSYCAWRVGRRTDPGIARDDLLQEGRLALWLADRDGRIPDDPQHARNYVIRRALGAMRDADRAARRQYPHESTDDDDEPRHEPVAPGTPERAHQLRQVVARIARRGSEQLQQCVELLADGLTVAEVGAVLRVTETRVSQIRAEARRIAAPCW